MASLTVIRSALLAACNTVGDWPVTDEVTNPTPPLPSAMLRTTLDVRHESFNSRRYGFTVTLAVDASLNVGEYERLLDAIGDGGYIDDLQQALEDWPDPPWSSARPVTSLSVTEEQLGQLLAQTVDITVEVWE